MQNLRNSFFPPNISNDLLDGHLQDLRVWSLDYDVWRISLTYTTSVRGNTCMRLFLFPNDISSTIVPYGTFAQRSRPGLTTTFFQPSDLLYSAPAAYELAVLPFSATTLRDVYTAMSTYIPGYRILSAEHGHQGWVACVINILAQQGYLNSGAPQELVRRIHRCRAVSIQASNEIQWPIQFGEIIQE
ncbi:hypothetical protein M413DRAFT_447458 [Hebeloma cylindrosporum]|uniref:Uncharacterized protein n=1 Tax=Hebeloma cylindrosporum TaxID=76867 RepID=A0A0C2XN95_HEBCY|nr:hypothetical protein M413DRAFT_447458 [Hebeloma cylindrosporum h7]